MAAFHAPMLDCYITSLLLSINRVVYQRQQPAANVKQPFLFSNICEYINAHLEEDLSLDALAREFYVSKYHISHVFKDNMGMSVHQYLVKKRLDASKNSILSGMPLHEVATAFGFRDYTSFFRSFKKEFGVAPREFKEAYSLHSSSVPGDPGTSARGSEPPEKITVLQALPPGAVAENSIRSSTSSPHRSANARAASKIRCFPMLAGSWASTPMIARFPVSPAMVQKRSFG